MKQENSRRNISKRSVTVLSILFLLVLFSFSVSALGISPGKKTIDFEPGKTVKLVFSIINSEGNDLLIRPSFSGEQSALFFSEEEEYFASKEDYKTPIEIIVNLPTTMEPGIHTNYLTFTPIIKTRGDNMFSALVSPQAPINIRVPYPSKYAIPQFYIVDVDEGTPALIFLEFDNLGSEEILRAGGSVEIIGPDNEVLYSLKTEDVSIKPGKLENTQALPAPLLRRGEYLAIAKTHYDNIEKEISSFFRIGEPKIKIVSLETEFLKPNSINEIKFLTYNNWNKPLTLKGFAEIGRSKNDLQVFELNSEEIKPLQAYLDTKDLEIGYHNLTIAFAYDNKIELNNFEIEIREETFVEGVAESVGGKGKLIVLIAILIIVLLVIIGLIVFLIMRGRNRSKPGSMSETFK